MWEPTSHTNRKALVESISQESSSLCIRGNCIWMIVDQNLILFEIKKIEGIWYFRKLTEENFDIHELSCPGSYLDQSRPVNHKWREQLNAFLDKKNQFKKELFEDFQKIKDSDKKLIVTTDSSEVTEVVLESTTPLQGRYKGGKLYNIPLKRIVSWRIE